MTVLQSRIHTFIGANIKGTPAMRAAAVEHDLAVLRWLADLLVLQEFRWPWYWRAARRVMRRLRRRRRRWSSTPGFKNGLARPVFGAQACMWRSELWRRKDVRARLLHDGEPKVSEDRFIRAALLEDRRVPELDVWIGSTHFVVRGDMAADPKVRRDIMARDLEVLDDFLGELVKTGKAVIFELDANLRPGSAVYPEFRRILKKHGARIVGHHGVEFLFVIDGDDVGVMVLKHFEVGVGRLKTDHEARGMHFRLYRKA